jgi:2,3-bisphosphoglycerate-dependent phosphoglycerate mutase
MRKEYASLRRRPFLAPVWILTFWAIVALGVAAWVVHAATTTVVVVVRHADKANDGTDDPPLTPAGVERAARLAGVLGTGGPTLGIDAIFISQYRRSAATAEPLAAKLGIPVIKVPADDLKTLEHRVRSDFHGQRVLVVAHSDTIPEIVKALGGGVVVPELDASDYGTAYVIAIPRWNRPTVLRLALP